MYYHASLRAWLKSLYLIPLAKLEASYIFYFSPLVCNETCTTTLYFFFFPPFCKKDFSWISIVPYVDCSVWFWFLLMEYFWSSESVTSGSSNFCSHHPIAFSCMLKQEVVFRVYLTEEKGSPPPHSNNNNNEMSRTFWMLIISSMDIYECDVIYCFWKLKKKFIYRFYFVILMKCPQLFENLINSPTCLILWLTHRRIP